MAKGASAVWEIRPTAGSDTNGGAYDSTISGAGTDYTQQNAAQVAVADAVTNNTTTVTSATAGFTAAMIGNAIYLSGTGTTTDRYFVTAVGSSTSITVDRATGSTGGTGVTLNLGGALATLSQALGSTGGIGSNKFWIKATGTLAVTATATPPAGANDKPTVIAGYTTTRGDGGQATIQISSGSFFMITLSNVVVWVKNLVLDCNSATSSRGISGSAVQCLVDNVTVKNFTDFGIAITSDPCVISRCLVISNGTGATSGLYSGGVGNQFVDCAAVGLTCKGWRIDVFCHMTRCVAANNSGATSDGLFVNGAQSPCLNNCVFYNNGRAGIYLGANGSTNNLFIFNCILAKNAGYGIDNETATTSLTSEMLANYNFFWSNTSGARNNFPTGANDVSGSGDPFVTPAGSVTTLADVWTNFALNNTASAGAACRGAGYPSYLDIGAVQSQATGGTAGMLFIPNLEGT